MAFSQLRPLGIGEILDGAFGIYRRNFTSLFLTALLPQLPIVAVVGAMAAAGALTGDNAPVLILAVLVPLVLISLVVIVGGVTWQFSRAYTGQPVSTGQAIRRGAEQVLPLGAALLLVWILAFLGFFAFMIGMIVMLASLFAVIPAVVLERRGPLQAISRSWQLISGGWLEVLVIGFVVFMLQSLPSYAMSMGFSLGALILGPETTAGKAVYISGQVLSGLSNTLIVPFWLGCKVLLYYDRRVRTEALDVQMMTEALNALPGAPVEDVVPAPVPAGRPIPRWG
ncbi:DUF7544 domain-containing protein [Longimicrobium sp.]|uniref:DUF7544 domain-containing protein n=1 Tax=Longimicrobium sp. TaxID=2029185 RepID=UPI002D0505E4|nr:hypothetical protein [Longimicrobium sp.]HSU17791.1 hypothetical protein [Longimicrobium sp.]